MAATRIVRVRIEGQVQGVFYRGWAEAEAKSLGLTGWVRNRRDGSVEALFAGPADKVGEMLQGCELGPDAAKVVRVMVLEEGGDAPTGFRMLPTK